MDLPAFWLSTWKEVQMYIIAYERKELEQWRRARFISFYSFLNAGGQEKSIFKFLPLSGDPKQEQRVPLSKEELAKVFSIYK